MQVRIPKAIALAHSAALEKIGVSTSTLSWQDHVNFDMENQSKKNLRSLCDDLEGDSLRGVPTLIKDIEAWILATSSTSKKASKLPKARSVKQAYGFLKEFIRKLKSKTLYQRVQKGNEGVTLAYYAEQMNFHPRDRYHPEYFTLHLAYEEFGVILVSHTNWQSYDCLRMSAPEMLLNKGYMTETVELKEDYDNHLASYSMYRNKIGKQFLAVGLADDKGVDGNTDDNNRYHWWYNSKNTDIILDKGGEPARVVIDVFRESNKDKDDKDDNVDYYFWSYKNKTDDPEEEIELEEGDETPTKRSIIPIHPFVVVFDLKKHVRLRVHMGNLEPYKYEEDIRERLVLPEANANLIDTLLLKQDMSFKDIVKGKAGGIMILCQGPPGTGKTLTAEVYAESLKRALYTVQCSQLGLNATELEDNLMKVLARGRRWGAVMLLDEADVYVHERGNDLVQNAIVGVFLRVLEYHAGVLFLTTNREDLVDDAILSRCTARIPYHIPAPSDQGKIWESLSKANGLTLKNGTIKEIVKQHKTLSGRDIKNLLKLARMVAEDRGCKIDAELITEMRQFKPTTDGHGD